MAEFVNTIDLLGDEAVEKAFIERTITEFKDDVLTAISGQHIFRGCTALISVDLPNVTGTTDGTFQNCSALTSVNIPNVTNVGNGTFNGCSALTSIDLLNAKNIAYTVFYGCSILKTIILRSETLCTLSAINSFSSTPFESNGAGGTVYVPQALIEQYQTATNWSSLYAAGTCNFVAIEGSEYE